MLMTESEIVRKFRMYGGTTKNSQSSYIKVLAELNDCNVGQIRDILDGKKVQSEPNPVCARSEPRRRHEFVWVENYTLKRKKQRQRPLSEKYDGIISLLIAESVECYIASLSEDNERLAKLKRKTAKYGRGNDDIDWRIEVNGQKIAVLQKWLKEETQ